jgi:hypothetical protein
MKRLTGDNGRPEGEDFADPSPPDLSVPGEVRVYTTNNFALVWKDSGGEPAADRFLRGEAPVVEYLDLTDTDGLTPMGAWDPTIEFFGLKTGPQRILYAGVMTPPAGQPFAIWPDDNWRRRVSAFAWKDQHWVRMSNNVEEAPPDQPTWINHSYGHQIVRDRDGKQWMFYERVTQEQNGFPWLTEIFARQMLTPT